MTQLKVEGFIQHPTFNIQHNHMATTSTRTSLRILRFTSQFLKSLWLFFPGILFLLFTIFCFWVLGQGKDILIAFNENRSRTILSFNYSRFIFFLAIGFWVYVSWYSSRIISYIKKTKLRLFNAHDYHL